MRPFKRESFVSWVALLAGIATASASTLSFAQQDGNGQHKPLRSSNDPPVPARGKLGQDLFLAIDHRDAAKVKSLLESGADPNSQNGLEFTPLYIAAASYQMDVMALLLGAGASVDAETTYGTALTFAAATGNAAGANILISKGANVNVARTDGITVLMMAANSGNPELVKELIKRNANVLSQNVNGSTALTYAARGGHEAVGRVLLDSGVLVDRADNQGDTPLMTAAMNGHARFVKLLLENGANPNLKNTKGQTALSLAAAYGDYPEVVKALLAAGADAKTKDERGSTPGVVAAMRGYSASAAALGVSAAQATKLANSPRSTTKAVDAGIKLLESSMKTFNEKTNCVSCHQEGLGRMTMAMARERGLKLDESVHKAVEAKLNGGLSALTPLHEAALKDPETMKQLPLIEMNEVSPGYSWLLAGMVDNKRTPDEATAAMAMVLGKQQAADGHWSFSLPRVPMQSSNFTLTALAAKSLAAYGSKSDAKEVADRINSAREWLTNGKPKSNEDRASRLLGLKWTSANAETIQSAVKDVLANQRPDGGWSQGPNLQSDAYSTGQALYALHHAGGLKVTDAAYKRGVQFLLRTQDADGSWFVVKRALPANNYFDGGFPHGESQYASFNGTCWATMALMETMPKAKK